jgi:hypothetical protein
LATGVTGRAERGDEQLGLAHLAGCPVHDRERRAGAVYEHALGHMHYRMIADASPAPTSIQNVKSADPMRRA